MIPCSNVFHIREFRGFFYCLYELIRLNSIACSVQNSTADVVFVDRFRYQLNMFRIPVLVALSRLPHAHIAYETDTANIIATFCRISCCLHDFMRLNSIVCHVQTTRCAMMWFSQIDSDINWLCFTYVYWQGYLDPLILILHNEIVI